MRAVGECVQILKGVTPGTPFSFDGQVHRVQGYNPSWAKAPKPPVYVAVNKPQMLRMAARLGDGIMLSDLTPPICAGAHRLGAGPPAGIRPRRRTPSATTTSWPGTCTRTGSARGREAKMWLGYRGLFRRWVLNTFMTDAEYDVIEAHKADIYGMVPKQAWSVPGVPDALLDSCVENLTLAGTPGRRARFVDHLRKMGDCRLHGHRAGVARRPRRMAIRLSASTSIPALA